MPLRTSVSLPASGAPRTLSLLKYLPPIQSSLKNGDDSFYNWFTDPRWTRTIIGTTVQSVRTLCLCGSYRLSQLLNRILCLGSCRISIFWILLLELFFRGKGTTSLICICLRLTSIHRGKVFSRSFLRPSPGYEPPSWLASLLSDGNLAKPTTKLPALLLRDGVTTFFHETDHVC
jgi:hypothetical protein